MTFDFTEVFGKIGQLFIRGLSLRIRQQRDIAGQPYSRPELSTLKARQRMLSGTRSWKGTTKGITLKGKTRKVQGVGTEGVAGVPITRLLVSQDTANRGFAYKASKDQLIVKVAEGKHIKMGKAPSPTYKQIIGWNSKGQTDVNPGIKRPPLVFPTNTQEVVMMKQEVDFAQRMFEAEASKQMSKLCTLHLRKVLSIG